VHDKLPPRPNLEHYRKEAKALVSAVRHADETALVRAEATLGTRARERFVLADAQHVVAREAGFRTWPELRRAIEDGQPEERWVEPGVTYGDGVPVRIRIRRRERRIRVDDAGETLRRAAKPGGWHAVAEEVVERWWVNVNRAGVVFVPAVVGRDIERLARQVAEACAELYGALLELDD
jgi:hypothetical protein